MRKLINCSLYSCSANKIAEIHTVAVSLGDADEKYLCILDTGANVHIITNKSLFSSGSLKSCGKVQIEGTSGVNERISTSGVLYGLGEAYYDEKCFINVLSEYLSKKGLLASLRQV